MNKIEKVLLVMLCFLLFMWSLIIFLPMLVGFDRQSYWLIIIGLGGIFFWNWYFGIGFRKFQSWRMLIVGICLSILVWFIVRVFWNVLGYGFFIGGLSLVAVNIVIIYLVYVLVGILVFEVWLNSQLMAVVSRSNLSVIASVLIASLLVLFGDVNLSRYFVLVILCYLSLNLGKKYGYSLTWGMIVGYLIWGEMVDYYLVNKGLLVLLLPGPDLIEIIVLIVCIVISNKKSLQAVIKSEKS